MSMEKLNPWRTGLAVALTAAIVQKMLHQPITSLKKRGNGRDGREFVPAVRELFHLDEPQ